MAMLMLSIYPSLAATPTSTTFLRLQLFNDTFCTIPSPVVAFSQPVPVQGISTCVTAPPSLANATGLASYAVGCGISQFININGTTINESFAVGNLWYGSPSSDAATCPTSANQTAVRRFFQVYDDSPVHSAASCVGPFTAHSFVNYTVPLSSATVYAQWMCNVTTTSNSAAVSRE